ncbi:hypothetical protein PBI_SMARTIES_58 [Microbacterium phage Smarties]|uniref:Uncharacterized protein n=1 Tax=Microbacterium phage Ariadne TaxID=2656546 RepID=A0A649VBW7_9CAUD|nr:hypothetical protein QDA10_gp058 [Microbacterium phage Ariadne]QGJ89462.1 hypothetical protein PBI_ARIADNE_58 [Microbacterium phage Ariadne]QGJ91449.1 hypothetical protein PBI_SMARTIES_58 [Microbacterium phage Smarties]
MAEQTPTPELPDNIEASDIRAHALSLSVVGGMINLTGKYLSSEDGSPAEAEAENELDEYVDRVVMMGPEVSGKALLVFASLITATAPQAEVQAWFDDQGERIKPFLTPEERGE